MLTKSELHAQQQAQLEQLVRDLREVEERKTAANKDFNASIKQVNDEIDSLLDEINEGSQPMFDSEGKPLITLANVK